MIRLRHLLTATLLLCLASAKAQEVTFSTPGGFYDNPFELTLSCNQRDKVIHYTTNGNTPSANDPVYRSPLLLDESLYSHSDIYTILNCPETMWFLPETVQKCIIIRAAAFPTPTSSNRSAATHTDCQRSRFAPTRWIYLITIGASSFQEHTKTLQTPKALAITISQEENGKDP